MEFFNLLENTLTVTEPYGGHVRWALTILLGMVVALCLHYVVKAYQTRKTEGKKSSKSTQQQPGQGDEPRVEEMPPVEDVFSLQGGQESLTCPICKKEQCADDHESTFLFHREQYKANVDVEHIKLTKQPEEDQSLTIFEEINQFKRLKTVTIIGLKLDDTSLSNLFQCTSVRSLEMSNCQLASIPRSMANLKDLEILDLSHNNLTTLPSRPIRSMPCLKSLNVSHNKLTAIGDVVRKLQALQNLDVSYNDIGEIPYEILEMENLECLSCSHNKITRWLRPSNGEKKARTCPLKSLNMSSNLLAEVPQNVKELKHLSMVNFSDNKIGANMPDKIVSQQISELFYLPSVSTLGLGSNNIKSLSLDITKVSQNIELIDLSNNEICEVPAALLSMPTLSALHLGNNKITKLPTDLDLNKLSPTLCVIDLSNNELDDLPLALCFLTSLKKLDLKQNKISTISVNVKSCKSLSFLDVSGNNLKEIPPHVIDLPKLVEIHASNNQINSVSSLSKGVSSEVELVALAENGLSHFPEAFTQMKKLKKVDLSNNMIKVIPQSVMKMPKDMKMNLRDNPIIDPPLQVCQAGLQAIQVFYEDLTTASSIKQCLKTLFLGAYESGKTSLVRVLQLNCSKLTKPEERTHGIEIAELHLSAPNTSDITLSVWDFAGQETYNITHQFFLSAKALMLLIVDLEKYVSANFESTCGEWLENMIAKVGNPVVIPVVTHIDKLSEVEVKDRCDDLAGKLADQERVRIDDLRRQLKRINESHLGPELVDQTVKDRKKQIESLLQKRPTIHPKPVPVSSAGSLEGIQYLKQVILNYAVNKEYFPEVGRPIPKAWADTEACVEIMGKELSFPYMTWDEFRALLKENVPNLQPESRIQTVAQYLHDIGKILWYSEIESLRNHVFLKSDCLVDIFRNVIRHDLEKVKYCSSDSCYREAEISQGEFQKMKNDLAEKGVLHTKLLRCLWSDVEKKCRPGTFDAILQVLIELMRQFDLCYDIEEQQKRELFPRKLKQVLRSEAQPQISQRLLLPWYIKEDMGDMTKTQWESGESPIISLQYQFPSFIPPGLFDRLTVRAHRPKHNLHFVLHWKTLTLCKHKRHRILVLLKYEKVEGQTVSVSARAESQQRAANVTPGNLWETVKDLSLEVEDLLKQWPGVQFDRLTVCPTCHQPSFPGNWLHSSFMSLREEICSLCHERVSEEYLMPQPDPSASPLGGQAHQFVYMMYDGNFSRQSVHGPLCEQVLLHVAKKLGSDWESVAIHMGFLKSEVDEFKSNNPYNARQQKFTMLTTWRDRKGRSATRQELNRVLMEAGCDYDAISCLY